MEKEFMDFLPPVLAMYSQLIYEGSDIFCKDMQKIFNDSNNNNNSNSKNSKNSSKNNDKYIVKIFKKLFKMVKEKRENIEIFENLKNLWYLQNGTNQEVNKALIFIFKNAYDSVLEDEIDNLDFGKMGLENDDMSFLTNKFKKL
jgi:hypothetical protein